MGKAAVRIRFMAAEQFKKELVASQEPHLQFTSFEFCVERGGARNSREGAPRRINPQMTQTDANGENDGMPEDGERKTEEGRRRCLFGG